MGRTACTEPQCLYKGTLYPYLLRVMEEWVKIFGIEIWFNPLNPQLNPICNLLALFGAHHILHVSRIWVNPPIDSTIVDIRTILNVKVLISFQYDININGAAFCTVINRSDVE